MPKIRGRPLSIGKVIIGNPKSSIVVSVFEKNASEIIRKFESGELPLRNLYEIRFDLFENKTADDLVEMIKDLEQLDVDYIFTYRSSSVDECQKFYGVALQKLAPAVDIDLNIYRKLDIKTMDTKLMLSFHNFSDNKNMFEAFEDMVGFHPDIYKLAVTYHSDMDFMRDLTKLSELKSVDNVPLAYIPMGKNNEFLRIVSSYFVSDIVYARIHGETAPGQLRYEEYQGIFKLF